MKGIVPSINSSSTIRQTGPFSVRTLTQSGRMKTMHSLEVILH